MPRTDIHFDAMLRHLGAAYYESLHGQATRADVSRALDTVEEHLHEQSLLDAQATIARRLRSGARRTWWPHGRHHPALTAGELMTSPAVTIGPDATVPAAARLMNTHHVRRLPVVDEKDRIIGLVSRRDLLSVFLRPDEEITADIRKLLDEILSAAPGDADVSVRDGIVTLTGTLDPGNGPQADLIPLAVRLMWNVDGVVDVIDRLGEAPADGRDETKGLAQLAREGDQDR